MATEPIQLLLLPEPQEFHLFPHLPPELRRMIWRECRPHRVIELDSPHPDEVDDTTCRLYNPTLVNSRPPIISRVCRESREVAFEDGAGVLGRGRYNGIIFPQMFGPGNATAVNCPWFSPTTDIVHHNWNEGENPFRPCRVTPFSFFQTVAATAIAASIDKSFLHKLNGNDTNFSPYIDKDLTLLEHQKHYFVTIYMVTLHVSIAQAARSGLFGRLVEERVKLIDAADTKTLHKYYYLWLEGPREDEEPAEFFNLALSGNRFQGPVLDWREGNNVQWIGHKWKNGGKDSAENPEQVWFNPEKDDVWPKVTPFGVPNINHPWVKKTLEDIPRFTPMIMFRLCEQKCFLPPSQPPSPPPSYLRSISDIQDWRQMQRHREKYLKPQRSVTTHGGPLRPLLRGTNLLPRYRA
ncbi:hypothetical protein F5884DRAFT_380663 [Xylogone sp. PMI_703]|nr:hypothetical protein F5884DRAFT_380663 [Xylogone sp. PMI_703]